LREPSSSRSTVQHAAGLAPVKVHRDQLGQLGGVRLLGSGREHLLQDPATQFLPSDAQPPEAVGGEGDAVVETRHGRLDVRGEPCFRDGLRRRVEVEPDEVGVSRARGQEHGRQLISALCRDEVGADLESTLRSGHPQASGPLLLLNELLHVVGADKEERSSLGGPRRVVGDALPRDAEGLIAQAPDCGTRRLPSEDVEALEGGLEAGTVHFDHGESVVHLHFSLPAFISRSRHSAGRWQRRLYSALSAGPSPASRSKRGTSSSP
jgi:hypothetical protein